MKPSTELQRKVATKLADQFSTKILDGLDGYLAVRPEGPHTARFTQATKAELEELASTIRKLADDLGAQVAILLQSIAADARQKGEAAAQTKAGAPSLLSSAAENRAWDDWMHDTFHEFGRTTG